MLDAPLLSSSSLAVPWLPLEPNDHALGLTKDAVDHVLAAPPPGRVLSSPAPRHSFPSAFPPSASSSTGSSSPSTPRENLTRSLKTRTAGAISYGSSASGFPPSSSRQ